MALGDRAGTVFPKEFYMPRVHCVQARDFCIWRQLAPPPRLPCRPTQYTTITVLSGRHVGQESCWPDLPASSAGNACWQVLAGRPGQKNLLDWRASRVTLKNRNAFTKTQKRVY